MSRNYAPVQKKSWFARHKFLTAILIFIVAIIAVSAFGGEDSNDNRTTRTSSSSQSSSQPSSPKAEESAQPDVVEAEAEPAEEEAAPAEEAPEEAAEPAEEAVEEAPGVGSTINNGEFDITVTSYEAGLATVESGYFQEEATGQYVRVFVTVTNTSNEAHYFFASSHKLIDDQSRQHTDSSDAIFMDDALSAEEINPGVTVEGYLLYDIPADATVTEIQFGASGFFDDPIPVTLN
ncbi:DUF4352 domain-containing protein [Flaviflexus massiliensis]|uniref:DUF4352 domain-containing protein n=1 Tax=Flaviflexus massiliensis TaxID=1522309 RepID=UPI0006D52A6E|nr:DUF4352 domain-containing protein [Flaviflexus massiliensis]